MKKVLIIGGGGFIGSNITQFLLKNRDYNIDLIDNFSRSSSGKAQLLEKYSDSDRLKIINSDLTILKNFNQLDSDYDYVFSLFLQPAPEFWVYMSYDGKRLKTFSSNERYNSEMISASNANDKFIAVSVVDENYILDFINSFRLTYFGIEEPYNLMSPSDTFLEDEVFKTVSDDEDDGF